MNAFDEARYGNESGAKIEDPDLRPWGEKVVCWRSLAQPRHFEFSSPIAKAAICPGGQLLCVVAQFGDSVYRPPNNAVFINPDGTLNHQIVTPRLVRKGSFDPVQGWIEPPAGIGEAVVFPPGQDTWIGVHIASAGWVFQVEAVRHVDVEAGRLRLHLTFAYEWCEIRFYDPVHRLWQERAGIYRQ